MANIGYPLDEIGTSPTNRVTETRTLTKKAIDGRAFVIPKAAPFYSENSKVIYNGVILVRDVDYHLILESPELSHVLEKQIVGGIIFNTATINSNVTFEVQTVGGDFNLPIGNTVENMAQIIRNPLFTTWSQLVGTPTGLPTWSHVHDWSSTVGWEGFMSKLDLLILSLNSGSGSSGELASAALKAHLLSTAAHDKSAVGLGNVSNFTLAQDEDYNKRPYPNDRYVTPRSVMYAITRFIGDDLAEMSAEVKELRETVSLNTNAYNELLRQWENVQVSLNLIDRSYAIMTEQVAGYNESLNRLEIEYRAVVENQQVWLKQLSDFNTTLIQYGKDYNAIIATQENLIAEFTSVKKAYDDFKVDVTKLKETVDTISKTLDIVVTHTMYPVNKVLTAGSFNFRIRPKEVYYIVLIGGGGGVGDYVTDAAKIGYNYNGENGSSTSLWCLQDITNGEATPSALPVVIAGGGFGGGATYGDAAGVVSSHGLGGRGGQFVITPNTVTVDESSFGEGGLKGHGAFVKGTKSIQDMGYEYYGHKFGKGATAEDALGQGGEAAIVRFRIENKLNKDLEFMVKVGEAGRSYSLERFNANGGLAILNKIK